MTNTLEVLTLPVGQMLANCYIYYDVVTLEGVIIDPGDEADFIYRVLSDKKINPLFILATHGHFDHLMAVTDLKLAYNIPFLINKGDKFLVDNLKTSAKYFLGIDVGFSPAIDGMLSDKFSLKIGSHSLKVVVTPGHTPGGVCFYDNIAKILFSGDLLFAQGGIGRTDFSYSNKELLKKSLIKIFKFSPQTLIYPGHGDSSTIGQEIIFHDI